VPIKAKKIMDISAKTKRKKKKKLQNSQSPKVFSRVPVEGSCQSLSKR
jgi:hypothetical protein